jgi:hypothetical protein
MNILCLLLNFLRRSIDILHITQVTFHKSDSAVILSKFNSLSNSPFIICDIELVLAPCDNNDLFDPAEKELGCDFYIEKESVRSPGVLY